MKTKPAEYCSVRCFTRSPQNLENAAAHAKRRRARLAGSMVEFVNVIAVFERDGWCCHFCDEMTLPEARGTPHLLAPQLDHIIPLALGGAHSYANTACIHRICNMKKGARIAGKLAEAAWSARLMTDSTNDNHQDLAA